MVMLVPFAASAAVEMAVKGGAIMMSQCLECATSGVNAEKNARVSASVLYIFQLPAITRRRMPVPPKTKRTGRNACPTRAKESVCSFVGESFDSGKFASGEKFEGSAAAGGDMGDVVREAGPMNGCDGVAASDDGSSAGAGGGSDGFGDLDRAFCERGHLEYAHGAVPDDGFCARNFLAVGFDAFRANVQAHPPVGCGGEGNGLRRGVRFEFRADDVIHGKQEREFLLLGFFTQTPREVQFVVFDQRLADGLAVGFEEGVSHAAADKHGVGNFHQVFDDFDFVADFGPAENRDEGTRGIGHGFAEVGHLFFHEQPRSRLLDEARDADNGSMRAVSGAEGVANENAVTERGELLRKGFVVFFFVGMEADVFQHEYFPVAQGLALAFSAWTDTIQGEGDRLAEQLFQFFGGGPQRIFRIRAALWPAEMRSKHEPAALFDGEPQGRKSFADACVVGDDAVLQGNVEVHADENAFAAEVEVVDGELSHDSVTREIQKSKEDRLKSVPHLESRGQEPDQVAATAGVAPLVVVPGQNLDTAVADDFGVLRVHY